MEGQAAATAAEPEKMDIIAHLSDRPYLDLPFVNAPRLVDGRVSLPRLPVFELFGIPIDLSITRDVVLTWVCGLVVVTVLVAAFRRPRAVPTGLASLLEPVVLYVRDQIVTPVMGEDGRPFLPYLETVFFFILTGNLLGLVPYSTSITANISVTAALALCTLAVMVGAGIARHGVFGYVVGLVPAGVPLWLAPLMLIVELLGLFTKPAALCIRLFANNVAGHAVILALIGLVFVFRNAALGLLVVPFTVFLYLLEVLVAFVQAFVFTLLSSLFIGVAVHPGH